MPLHSLIYRTSYLVRAEMIAFHEGEVSYLKNPKRGAQFYPNCVQLEVEGDGTVQLPKGVSFPGAYSYDDPGVVYDVNSSPTSSPRYHITLTSTGLLLDRNEEDSYYSLHNHVPYSWPNGLVWCMGRDDCGSARRCNGPHNSGAMVDMDPEFCCHFCEFLGQEEYHGCRN
jgi:hypothetical protein